MTAEEITIRLAELGREEAEATRRLVRIQAERCGLLRALAQDHGAALGVSSTVVSESVAPKDPPPNGGH
jgi:hypothetical protein